MMELEEQHLIRALKYLTQTNSCELSQKECKIILNEILSQNLNDENIRDLIINIKSGIQGNKHNYVENFILSPSMLYLLINKQLKKYDLETIFKDFFNCIQNNNEINSDDLKTFLNLCNKNMARNSSIDFTKINLNMIKLKEPMNYNIFINMMEQYLKKKDDNV
ncbi:conserved Plasmodium protein, unknown function [Plasmodium reichenowi]|uniref:Uncharacterized protein n=1 Tax=Plasmodium reichenowi TaxID=5854 RepID=A0A060RVZ1_PLARE|nr:hypothetical protein PRSY57_1226300 [Plasmodium reichenowi]KYN95374.1 hypothetical protein PRSY57_1226300 [Plasmodium reichenowi]CDO65546.1 conserved Plasmodium protein, unknown function [Plasmodium reichenowi]SOV80707.1 conserved Plasmodium protein, unknown function [Plasmodium reichenowi]